MNERKVFQDSVTPIHADQGLTVNGLMVNAIQPQHREEKMLVHFSFDLPPDAQTKLENAVAHGEVVPPEELQKNYIANPADIEKLSDWLTKQGFEIVPMPSDGTSLYARAEVAQIQKSLAVKMVRVTKEGITYTAAQDAPSLPVQVGKAVHAIIGLQPFRHASKHFRKTVFKDNSRRSLLDPGKKPKAVANTANRPPYLVPEILKAYGADNLGVSGKGQTIAILIDTVPNNKDLQKFWKANGVSVTTKQIKTINVQNVAQFSPPEGEETLDVSWASGIAPGSNIRIYASGSLQFTALDMALDAIIADLTKFPGMRQLSISLGLGETFMGGANGEVATQHGKFLKLAAAGVNVFVSSGDAGSNPDVSGHSPAGPTQAEYESSDSCVVGVGGTSLKLAQNGAVSSEVGWVSGGGGKSIFFDRPIWQKGAGVPDGNKRLVPDVSSAADPNEGAFLVLQGEVQTIGGTSWSAPMWAGFCALINEARAKAGKPPLPFLNPLIYPLLGTAAFRDITSGSNGAFSAGPGYDMVTGLGVPNVRELIRALTA